MRLLTIALIVIALCVVFYDSPKKKVVCNAKPVKGYDDLTPKDKMLYQALHLVPRTNSEYSKMIWNVLDEPSIGESWERLKTELKEQWEGAGYALRGIVGDDVIQCL